MKNLLKRTLGLVLALTLLVGLMVPVALADSPKAVANPTHFKDASITTYTGLITTLSLADSTGATVSNSNYKWKSSKKSVVSVDKNGVITAKKSGKATITATNMSNKKDKCKIKITVKKNKVDNLVSKPSPGIIPNPGFTMALKSVEIASPTKIVVEYYYIQNFPGRWKSLKLNYVTDTISVLTTSTGSPIAIASGTVKNIKVSAKGAKVKVVKVTYKGGLAKVTNICLPKMYRVTNDPNMDAQVKYQRPR